MYMTQINFYHKAILKEVIYKTNLYFKFQLYLYNSINVGN